MHGRLDTGYARQPLIGGAMNNIDQTEHEVTTSCRAGHVFSVNASKCKNKSRLFLNGFVFHFQQAALHSIT